MRKDSGFLRSFPIFIQYFSADTNLHFAPVLFLLLSYYFTTLKLYLFTPPNADLQLSSCPLKQ